MALSRKLVKKAGVIKKYPCVGESNVIKQDTQEVAPNTHRNASFETKYHVP